MTVDVLVPVSGGKDSQAVLQLAIQKHPRAKVRGLFCDTQFEHPKTYEHVAFMEAYYDVPIDRVTGGTVLEKVLKHGRFPGGGARHCTQELKIRETRIYAAALAREQGKGFEVWYGMRTGESTERARRYKDRDVGELHAPHELLPTKYPKYLSAQLGVWFRLPILDWSEGDVFDFLDGMENPLYDEGFDRVGCFPCLASGDRWKEKAFNHDDFGREQYIRVTEISKQIGKSIWTSKGGAARAALRDAEGPGCMVCAI